MGSSPVTKEGAFITEFDADLGEHVEKRVPYDVARAAEGTGKTVKYTHKEKARREGEEKGGSNRLGKDTVRDQATAHKNLTKKDSTYAKSTIIDELAQKEIEGKTLDATERRTLDLARAQGADTTTSTSTPRTRIHLGEGITSEQAGGAVDVGAGQKRYKGSETYGLEQFGRVDPRLSEANYKRYEGKMDDYRKLSDEDFEEKHGHKKGK